MQNVNVVAITGNLTRDVELRTIKSGTSIATLGVAVNAREKHGGEWEDYASFFDVTVWGKTAENCAEYLAKGRPVAITGRLRQERWEKDGNKRSKVVIVASSVQFLPSKDGGGGGSGSSGSYEEEDPDSPPPSSGEDDIPF